MRFGHLDMQHIDGIVRLTVVTAILLWNVKEGAVFHNEYPKVLVHLYPIAFWRLTLLVATILGALWCPSVGLMMAYAVFFYVMDMEITLEKWV